MSFFEDLEAGRLDGLIVRTALRENVEASWLAEKLRDGRAVLLGSRARRDTIRAAVVGEGFSVKVNANIGTSESASGADGELEKLSRALEAGADAVMDLSTGGDLPALRRRILSSCDVSLGTVPIYEAAVTSARSGDGVTGMTVDEMLGAVRNHAEQGVDFLTIHCGLTRAQVQTAGSR
ncbi:MAG: phosphomethylpyrimidine synthase ThiC, partial [Actinomycetota bacterium]|nr:phosphomethylpyrimidine synthase ThiC [Actinomycetota bacterium]